MFQNKLQNTCFGVWIIIIFSLITTSFYVNYTYNNYQKTQINDTKEVEIFIIDREYNENIFSYQYTVLLENSVWLGETKEKLEPHSIYLVKTEVKIFTANDPGFDQYLSSKGLKGLLNIKEISKTKRECNLLCLPLKAKNRIVKHVQESLNPENHFSFFESNKQDVQAFNQGLLIGDEISFTKETRENINKSGVSHLIVVSGFQVTLILVFLERLLLSAGIEKHKRVFLTGLGVVSFLLIAGLEPPIIRASLSFILYSFVLYFFQRKLSYLQVLLLTAVGMLWINPLFLFSKSYQLSFISSFVLAYFTQDLEAMLSRIKQKRIVMHLVSGFWLSLIIYLFTLPILATFAEESSIFSVINNVFMVPLSVFVTFNLILGLIPIIGDFFTFVSNNIISLILIYTQIFPETFFYKLTGFQLSNFGLTKTIVYYFTLFLSIKTTEKIWKIIFLKRTNNRSLTHPKA